VETNPVQVFGSVLRTLREQAGFGFNLVGVSALEGNFSVPLMPSNAQMPDSSPTSPGPLSPTGITRKQLEE
jgi:hypothetical protein